MKAGELHVWRVRLDEVSVPPPTSGEAARAARFQSPQMAVRYLRAHAALRVILGRSTGRRLDFAVTEKGKPYLPGVPELRFNLSRSHGMALVGVALELQVGVDVERLRPMPNHLAVAERYFPPGEAAELQAAPAAEREREFFRRWTRLEAVLKAAGVGLYGAGSEVEGDWTIEAVETGVEFAAAVAAEGLGVAVILHDFGEDE